MTIRKKSLSALAVTVLAVMLSIASCGIYTFSGTSIQPDVKSVTINYFEYKALRVNPSFSNDITEALKDKFKKMTRLEQVDMDGDLEIVGEVTGYYSRATAVTAQEVADRLHISPLTVCRHRENIKAKLGVRTLAELSAWYVRHQSG